MLRLHPLCLVLVACATFLASCESCSFSHQGTRRILIFTDTDEIIDPQSVNALVCNESGDCTTAGESFVELNRPSPSDPREAVVAVEFQSVAEADGCVGCAWAGLEIEASAPGCETTQKSVPRQEARETRPGTIELTLRCGFSDMEQESSGG